MPPGKANDPRPMSAESRRSAGRLKLLKSLKSPISDSDQLCVCPPALRRPFFDLFHVFTNMLLNVSCIYDPPYSPTSRAVRDLWRTVLASKLSDPCNASCARVAGIDPKFHLGPIFRSLKIYQKPRKPKTYQKPRSS